MRRWGSWKHLIFFLCVCFGVSCGGGSGSGGGTQQPPNPVPALTGITPNSATAGSGAVTLEAAGSGFISTSVIEWNGTALATTFTSNTSISAQVPPSNLVSAVTANVTVVNPPPGGGTSGKMTFTINPIPNPVPMLSALSPDSAAVGSGTLGLNASGSNFVPNSVVEWNGTALATTYVSSTSLSAQIPATELASSGTANVTVQNPAPGGGTSGALAFTVNANPVTAVLNEFDLEGSDLVWNPSQQKLYVAVPSTASSNASTITIIDPIAASITASPQLSSAASGLSISDDSQYLYAVISGGSAIQRFVLPALTPDIQWSIGTDTSTNNPYLAGDVKVEPGNSHSVAVSFGDYGDGSIAIFDDGVERTAVGGSLANPLGNSLQWKADGSALYAAYTVVNASPYYATTSDDALYAMPVSNTGVGAVTTYHSSFRSEGAHLHLDPTTGYAYGDWGEVVNSANGIPVGDYRWSRSNGTFSPGPLSIVDPALKRFYTLLEVAEPDGTLAFQIQSFDLTQFQLLNTIVVPDAVGEPLNFIRWGQSGLAFVTNPGFGSPTGKVYILDGSFVNPSGTQDTTAGAQLNAVPTLTAASPTTATVGSAGLSLNVTGRDFSGQTILYWNGTALQTSVLNNTQLSAQLPASDLGTVSLNAITASNSGAAFPASNSMPFAVNTAAATGNQISVFNTGGNNLVWDATAGKIYVSVPGVQGDSGDAIAIVDPVAGTVTSTGFIGSEPARLSLSDNGQYLYAALYGENAIEQLTLPTFAPNRIWNLGGAGLFLGPYYALDVQVEPGAAGSSAVILANFDVSPSTVGMVIYDGSTPRPTQLTQSPYPYSSVQWAGSSTIYAIDQEQPQDFLVLGVSAAGLMLNQHDNGVFSSYSDSIHYDAGTGLVYTDGGQAVQPSSGTVVGDYGASGIAVPDSTLNRVFILGQTAAQTGTNNYTIESFDQTSFTAVDSVTIDNVVGTPTALIRWGANGLAFTTRVGEPWAFVGTGPGQLYVVSGSFVHAASRSTPSPTMRPVIPVQKTWGSGSVAQTRTGKMVIHPSPWRR